MNRNIHIGELPLAPNRKAISRRYSAARRNSITLWELLAFLVPVLQFVQIPLGGQLLGTEIALLFLLPFLVIMRGRRLLYTLPRTYLLLATLWLFSQLFTDLLRATPFVDLARGGVRSAFALIAFGALYLLLYGHRRRILLFAAGLALGGILTYYLNPSLLAERDWWKFGLAIPLSLILVLLSTALNVRKLRTFGIALLILGALINFYLDFRSLGGIMALTASYQVLQAFMGRRSGYIMAVRPRHLLVLGIIIGAVALTLFTGYDYAAQEGLLPKAAQERYQAQSQGEYGTFLGGRTEILASSRAILDSPLIGHGSWATDCRYTTFLSGLRSQLGYSFDNRVEICLIPSHSHIFGAWVEAGVLGAIFWLWVLTLPVRALLRLYQTNERLVPVVAFFAFLLLWDLVFSPYGGEVRYRTPYEVVLMMMVLPDTLRQRRIKSRSHKNVLRRAPKG